MTGFVIPGLDVLWWSSLPPVMVWATQGISCAIAAGPIPGFNGYVQVPERHPWYVAESYDEIEADAHGGLTFGPVDGWVGFDTLHSFDYWSKESLEPYLDRIDEKTKAAWTSYQELGVDFRPYGRHWTVPLLVEEINHLAEQAAEIMSLEDAWMK